MEQQNTQIARYMLSLYPEFEDYETLSRYLEEKCRITGDHFLSEFRSESEYTPEYTEESRCDVFSEVKEILTSKNAMFAGYFAGFLVKKYKALSDAAEASEICSDPSAITADLVTQIYSSLSNIAMRTLIFELESAKKHDLLKGDTPDERFRYFRDTLLEDEKYVERLHSEYRIMHSQLTETAGNAMDFAIEMLNNTASHINAIRQEIFGGRDMGKLVHISMSGGDTHVRCRNVSTMIFENGRLVYKPHSLKSEAAFQVLLGKLNEHLDEESRIRLTKIVAEEDYGWTEFIEHTPVSNDGDAKVFFRKSGILLALLYICNATDFHFENVIASGTDPIPIDLETLFHCQPADKDHDKDREGGYMNTLRFFGRSVHSIGLLPSYINFRGSDGKVKPLSVGGMSGSAAQKSPFSTYRLENLGSDEVSMVRSEYDIGSSNNSAVLDDIELDPRNYSGYITDGFTDAYRIALAHRDELKELVLKLFADTRNRIVLKATFAYSNLLNISTHPDFQRSEIFAKLLFSRMGLVKPAEDFIDYEIDSLLHRNVPIYYADFTKRRLISGDGRIFNNVFEHSPQEEFIDKVDHLSEHDLEMQTDLIKTSYFIRNMAADHTAVDLHKIPVFRAKDEDLLRTASEIGDYLIDHRSIGGVNHKGKRDRFLIGCEIERTDHEDWTTVMSDFNFYNGASGAALFLRYLGRATGEKKYTDAAYELIEPIISVMEAGNFNYEKNVGAHTGIAGYFYVLNKFAEIDDDDGLRQLMKDSLSKITELAAEETKCFFDLISGVSGALAVTTGLTADSSDSELRELALKTSGELLDILRSRTLRDGELIAENIEYSGFAHGIAGAIPYIYRYYRQSGSEEALDLFRKLLTYERTRFRQTENGTIKGWLSAEHEGSITASWCHGTPGFLSARLILRQEGYTDDETEAEIAAAVELMKRDSIGTTLTSCHGDLGNLAILRKYADMYGDNKLYRQCTSTFAELYNKYASKAKDSSEMTCQKYNGIMLGLSGIGYSCLRETDDSIPDHLWLT